MLSLLLRWLTRAARWFAFGGVFCLLGAMAVTVVDVVLRALSRLMNTFVDEPVGFAITGVVDIVQLLVVAVAFMAIPFAFLRDAHVTVDLVSAHLPSRFDSACRSLAAMLALGFLWIVLTTGFSEAANQMRFGDRTMTLGIPFLWFWVPLLAGVAFSALATALLAIGHAAHAVLGGAPFGGAAHFPETGVEEPR